MAGQKHGMLPFPLKTKEIPRLSIKDDQVDRLIKQEQPVLITDSDLVRPALRWDLDFLQDHMRGKHTIYFSKSSCFTYFDDKKMKKFPEFKAPTWTKELTFSKYHSAFKDYTHRTDEYLYYQQQLTDQVDDVIKGDFLKFNWPWLDHQRKVNGWGELTSNLLLISHPGNFTPCHYDEQHNFFSMTHGYKRCILFAPSEYEKLYPNQVAHPCDRQSQVDMYNPNFNKFPKFKNACAYEALVGPGDVLYIPMYWWHHIESVGKDYTMSITFWFLAAPSPTEVVYPLNAVHKVSITRNIEKMLATALGNPREVGPFLRMMVQGRYDHKEEEKYEKKVF